MDEASWSSLPETATVRPDGQLTDGFASFAASTVVHQTGQPWVPKNWSILQIVVPFGGSSYSCESKFYTH